MFIHTVCLSQGVLIPDIEWEESGYMTEPRPGVNVPVMFSPLSDPEMLELQDINPLIHSDCFGVEIYLDTVQYIEHLLEATS